MTIVLIYRNFLQQKHFNNEKWEVTNNVTKNRKNKQQGGSYGNRTNIFWIKRSTEFDKTVFGGWIMNNLYDQYNYKIWFTNEVQPTQNESCIKLY